MQTFRRINKKKKFQYFSLDFCGIRSIEWFWWSYIYVKCTLFKIIRNKFAFKSHQYQAQPRSRYDRHVVVHLQANNAPIMSHDVYAIDGAMVSRISILNWIHLTASVIVNTKTTPLRFDRSNRKQLLFEVSVNSYKNTTDNLSIKTKGVFFVWRQVECNVFFVSILVFITMNRCLIEWNLCWIQWKYPIFLPQTLRNDHQHLETTKLNEMCVHFLSFLLVHSQMLLRWLQVPLCSFFLVIFTKCTDNRHRI